MPPTRRQVLAGLAGAGLVLGTARATYNVVLGYDKYTGTNILRQDLNPLVSDELRPSDGDIGSIAGHTIGYRDGAVEIAGSTTGADRIPIASTDPEEAGTVDDHYRFDARPVAELVTDLDELSRGDVRFEYGNYTDFFDRLSRSRPRPWTVGALRGRRTADPEVVSMFADADPQLPRLLVDGLADGFNEHTSYDLSRYAAGSVEDNVIFGAADLRRHFESPTDFEAMIEGSDSGLFCYELVFRSIEAFQAVPAPRQRPPVFAGYVRNERHKHAFTGLASVIRDEDGLVIPMTFLDYTRSTLFDDLRLTGIVGDGVDAYTSRQRVTAVHWHW